MSRKKPEENGTIRIYKETERQPKDIDILRKGGRVKGKDREQERNDGDQHQHQHQHHPHPHGRQEWARWKQ